MASAKSVLEKMITAMNRGGDASKRALLRAKDIDMFAKPTPKKTRALKKSPLPLRAYVSSKAAKKPRKRRRRGRGVKISAVVAGGVVLYLPAFQLQFYDQKWEQKLLQPHPVQRSIPAPWVRSPGALPHRLHRVLRALNPVE